MPMIQPGASVCVTSKGGWNQAHDTSATPTRIEFSASASQRAASQRNIRAGSGGHEKKGETRIGTSGT